MVIIEKSWQLCLPAFARNFGPFGSFTHKIALVFVWIKCSNRFVVQFSIIFCHYWINIQNTHREWKKKNSTEHSHSFNFDRFFFISAVSKCLVQLTNTYYIKENRKLILTILKYEKWNLLPSTVPTVLKAMFRVNSWICVMRAAIENITIRREWPKKK